MCNCFQNIKFFFFFFFQRKPPTSPFQSPCCCCLGACVRATGGLSKRVPCPELGQTPAQSGAGGYMCRWRSAARVPSHALCPAPRWALGVVWASSTAPRLRRAPRQHCNTCIPPSFLSAPISAPSPTCSLFTSTQRQAQPQPGPDQLGRCKHSEPQSRSAHHSHRWPERPAPRSWPTRREGQHRAGAGGCPSAMSALVLLGGSMFDGSSLWGLGRKAPPVRPWEPRKTCLLAASWDMENGRWPRTLSLAASPFSGVLRASQGGLRRPRLAFAYWSVWIRVRGLFPHFLLSFLICFHLFSLSGGQ